MAIQCMKCAEMYDSMNAFGVTLSKDDGSNQLVTLWDSFQPIVLSYYIKY